MLRILLLFVFGVGFRIDPDTRGRVLALVLVFINGLGLDLETCGLGLDKPWANMVWRTSMAK